IFLQDFFLSLHSRKRCLYCYPFLGSLEDPEFPLDFSVSESFFLCVRDRCFSLELLCL
ncbi:hypothetical protein GIB67_004870, partial [Kingdonia uniflora]